MDAPLIGVTGRRWSAARLATAVPPAMSALTVDVHFADYAASIAAAGGIPVQLTRDAPTAALLERLDGLVLSGGADIEPGRYGAAPEPDLGEVEPDRDAWELSLFEAAGALGMPVLGVCRGLQLVNVAFGGTLRQHVELDEGAGHPQWDVDGRVQTHEVTTVAGTNLRALVGESIGVNSLHHQVVDTVGRDLVVTAHASDDVVEGLETGDGRVLAVQWHPELLAKPDPTFTWIVERSRRYRARRPLSAG